MKVQSALQMNNYELQNAVVQNQGGFAEHDWRKGQLQFDSTQNVDKLAVGIDSGQGAEGSKYRYLLDSRPNGVSNEMLAGFSNTTSDIPSGLENFFPSCAAVKGFVNGIVASAMIYKGTLTPAQTSGQEITASMFIEGGVARTTLPTTKGWVYKCTASGYFGSIRMDTGDTIICNGGMDGTTADYDIVQGNIDLLNIPALRVVKDGKSIRIEDNSILLLNGSDNGPSLYLVDNGSSGYLRLSCEGDDYDNLKTSGWIDAGTLKENGTALASKYYLATNPSGFISGITKAMVEAVLTGSISSHSHAYLPLSGGEMAGVLRFHNTYGVLFAPETTLEDIDFTSGKGIRYFHGPSEDFEQYHYPFDYASGYNFGQQNSSLQLAWQRGQNGVGKLCARTSENNLYCNWVSIFHSGNLTPSDYLKKADGGTILGDVTIGASGNAKDLTVTGDVTAADVYAAGLVVKASGQSDAYIINESGRVTIDHTDGGGALGLEHLYPSNGESQIVVHGHIQPDSNGQLAIGSTNSQFLDVYAEEFFENGTSLSDKYAPKASTPKMFRANITGNGSTTTFTLTHNLGTQSPIVQIYEQTSREQVLVDVVANAANTVQVKFGAAPANGKVYNVVIIG